MPWTIQPWGTVRIPPLSPGLLGLGSHGHPHMGAPGLACLGLGSWGTQGVAPRRGPKGLLRHLWEV